MSRSSSQKGESSVKDNSRQPSTSKSFNYLDIASPFDCGSTNLDHSQNETVMSTPLSITNPLISESTRLVPLQLPEIDICMTKNIEVLTQLSDISKVISNEIISLRFPRFQQLQRPFNAPGFPIDSTRQWLTRQPQPGPSRSGSRSDFPPRIPQRQSISGIQANVTGVRMERPPPGLQGIQPGGNVRPRSAGQLPDPRLRAAGESQLQPNLAPRMIPGVRPNQVNQRPPNQMPPQKLSNANVEDVRNFGRIPENSSGTKPSAPIPTQAQKPTKSQPEIVQKISAERQARPQAPKSAKPHAKTPKKTNDSAQVPFPAGEHQQGSNQKSNRPQGIIASPTAKNRGLNQLQPGSSGQRIEPQYVNPNADQKPAVLRMPVPLRSQPQLRPQIPQSTTESDSNIQINLQRASPQLPQSFGSAAQDMRSPELVAVEKPVGAPKLQMADKLRNSSDPGLLSMKDMWAPIAHKDECKNPPHPVEKPRKSIYPKEEQPPPPKTQQRKSMAKPKEQLPPKK